MKSTNIFLFVLLLGMGFAVQAQVFEVPKGYALAESISVKEGSGYATEADQFFPIGWSEDGKFAYFIERNYDPIGTYPLFFIQDMVTDSILFFDGEEDFESEDHLDTVEDAWALKAATYHREMEKHGIFREDEFDWHPSEAFSHQGTSFEVVLDQTLGETSTGMGPGVQQLTLTLKKPGGEKEVFSFKNGPEHSEEVLNWLKKAEVLGVVKSPFEDRVFVLLDVHYVGFEGFTDSSYLLAGAHLEFGF